MNCEADTQRILFGFTSTCVLICYFRFYFLDHDLKKGGGIGNVKLSDLESSLSHFRHTNRKHCSAREFWGTEISGFRIFASFGGVTTAEMVNNLILSLSLSLSLLRAYDKFWCRI